MEIIYTVWKLCTETPIGILILIVTIAGIIKGKLN